MSVTRCRPEMRHMLFLHAVASKAETWVLLVVEFDTGVPTLSQPHQRISHSCDCAQRYDTAPAKQ